MNLLNFLLKIYKKVHRQKKVLKNMAKCITKFTLENCVLLDLFFNGYHSDKSRPPDKRTLRSITRLVNSISVTEFLSSWQATTHWCGFNLPTEFFARNGLEELFTRRKDSLRWA